VKILVTLQFRCFQRDDTSSLVHAPVVLWSQRNAARLRQVPDARYRQYAAFAGLDDNTQFGFFLFVQISLIQMQPVLDAFEVKPTQIIGPVQFEMSNFFAISFSLTTWHILPVPHNGWR